MYLKDGKILNANAGVTDSEGTQYDPNGWKSMMGALGITEVPDPVRPDDELFIITGRGEDGSYITTPRTEEDKAVIAAVKAKREADRLALEEVKADVKFQNLIAKTPAQAKNWVENNFPSLTAPEQKDLATLVIAIGILGRNL
jgi:hypothetical protein